MTFDDKISYSIEKISSATFKKITLYKQAFVTAYEFIFSKKISHQIARHATFWFAFILYFFMYRFYVGDIKVLSVADTYLIRLKNIFLFLPVSLFYVYLGLYFLLPRYIITGKYFQLVTIVLLTSAGFIELSYSISTHFDIKLGFDQPLERAEIIRQIDLFTQMVFYCHL